MHRIRPLMIFLLILSALLSACASAPAISETSAAPEPTETTAPLLTETAKPTLPPTEAPPSQPRPDTTPITTEPLLSLRQRLAEQLQVAEEEILLLEMRAETWSDGCLGAALPGEMCTMAIVPGYLLFLATPNGKIEVHTDEAMRIFRIANSVISSSGSPLVSWNRSGGIEGICWQMHIYMDGAYKILDCFSQQTLAQGSLPPEKLNELITFAAGMAPHEWATPQVLGADMFAENYTWFGPGNIPPEAQAQEHLNSYLGSLATLLIK